MTCRSLVAAVAVLALLPASAAAKGLTLVAVCGADGCVDRSDLASGAILDGGPSHLGPKTPEASFILRLGVGAGDRTEVTLHTRWLPKSRLMRGDDGTWFEPSSSARMALARLTRGLEPLPPVAMSGEELAPAPRAPEEAGGGDGSAGIALAVAAPAALAFGLVALVGVRRRRRPA